jgi:hypothetical protein
MIGMSYYYADESAQSPSDEENARAIRELIDDGYLQQILLSQDVFLKTMLTRYGGHGYGYILQACLSWRPGVGERRRNMVNPNGSLADKEAHNAEKILLVGNPGPALRYIKGFDQFATATWHTAQRIFSPRLRTVITRLPTCLPTRQRPTSPTQEALQWDAIICRILAPIRCCCIRIPGCDAPPTITLIHDYVAAGGALMMIGAITASRN